MTITINGEYAGWAFAMWGIGMAIALGIMENKLDKIRNQLRELYDRLEKDE